MAPLVEGISAVTVAMVNPLARITAHNSSVAVATELSATAVTVVHVPPLILVGVSAEHVQVAAVSVEVVAIQVVADMLAAEDTSVDADKANIFPNKTLTYIVST